MSTVHRSRHPERRRLIVLFPVALIGAAAVIVGAAWDHDATTAWVFMVMLAVLTVPYTLWFLAMSRLEDAQEDLVNVLTPADQSPAEQMSLVFHQMMMAKMAAP